MNSRRASIRPGYRAETALGLAALLLLPMVAAAQTAPTPDSLAKPNVEEVIALDPFEVTTHKDTSYGALNSNSITRFSTELNKMPITADIFTEDFMRDVDATSIDGMLMQYGAGMGMSYASPAGADQSSQPGDRVAFGDRFTPPPFGARGLGAGNIRRDGFTSNPTNTNSTNNFDIERVEVLRGPQGLLYGAGGAGGTIVSTSKRAKFSVVNGSLSERIDQYGSKRTLFDGNYGTRNVAARVALLRDDNQTRRLFIGDLTEGYYGQLAFRLPLRTTLRVQGEYTLNKRVKSSFNSVNFGGTANDLRNGYNLGYLLLTNQTGENNPATGAPYSKFGAINNGRLDFDNYNSFAGAAAYAQVSRYLAQATADTVWSKWLSTTVGFNYNRSADMNTDSGITAISAPLQNSNPLNDWAVGSDMYNTLNDSKHYAARASALFTKDFLSGAAKTQTVVGYDYEANYAGAVDYAYYRSDSNGNVIVSPTKTTDLGRTQMGDQWWPVSGGPQLHPLAPLGTRMYFSPQDNQWYTRVERNPSDPAWIAPGSPGNPHGNADRQFPGTGINGLNWGDYSFQRTKINAIYLSNFTSWWNDRLTTLVGYRKTTTRTPITGGRVGSTPKTSNGSTNLGLDGRITDSLRWYYSFSSTYNDATGFDTPLGDVPPISKGRGQEVGLKFNMLDSRVSGSLGYYWTKAKDLNTNFGSIIQPVNPTGLNGFYDAASGRNNWAPLDQKSNGVELILTAAPTRNWRMRLTVTQSDGQISATKSFGIVYNDQFYTDSKGNVTYKDGSPFLVPQDSSKVSKIKAAVDPATILTAGVASQQLTTAMMGNPENDYYAWGKGNPPTNNGQINSGYQGTPTTPVGNVLRYFTKPNVGTALTGAVGLPISAIQYAWPDPNNTGGSFVVTRAGDKTVGYPVYRVSFTNAYDFSEGWLKGFGAAISLNNAWQWRTYYYNKSDGTRALFSQPELGWQINLNPYYQRKVFRRYVWRTQLNIANLTNHYKVTITPNNGSGYDKPNNLGIRWDGQPRSFSWTNSISF